MLQKRISAASKISMAVFLFVACQPLALAQGANHGVVNYSTQKLSWQTNFERAVALAQKARKLVLVDIYTDWCGWCKKLDRDTYSNSSVAQYLNQRFVCLKMNGEDGGAGQALAQKYKVTGYPYILVLDVIGNRYVGAIDGYKDARELPESLESLIRSSH